MTTPLSPGRLRALRFLADKRYAIPSEIGYAVCEDRSKRGKGGMVAQGAGRLGGEMANDLVKLGYADNASHDRDGFAAYRINVAGRNYLATLDDGEVYVTCPECGEQQPDMGTGVTCEACGEGPMPYYRDGALVES